MIHPPLSGLTRSVERRSFMPKIATSTLQIIKYPDPRLRRRCQPVELPAADLEPVVRRMFELMYEAKGIGLAAPQVGIARRFFVCNPTGEPDGERVYVNPELTELVGFQEAEEGCLSIPGVTATIRRAARCRLRAMNLQGRPVEEEAEDLLARVWQHEIDHLDGVLILDHMSPASRIANRRAIRELEQDYEGG